MKNVINLSCHTTRCGECRHSSDCLMFDENGSVTNSTQSNKIRILHAGDHLYRAGETVDAVFRLRTGVVKTALTDSDGNEQVTGFYGPSEWVGLEALNAKTHRSDATVLDTASVCVIPAGALHERITASVGAAHALIDILGENLAHKDVMHLSLARDNAVQRMATFLYELSARQAGVGFDTDNIALPMSRGEIASYLALAVETVSRLLSRMQRDGILSVHRHHVEILDHDALARLCKRSTTAVRSAEAM